MAAMMAHIIHRHGHRPEQNDHEQIMGRSWPGHGTQNRVVPLTFIYPEPEITAPE